MTRTLAFLLALLMAISAPAAAQEDRDGAGFLQRLLEDSLSGVGREVRISGFSGALSSRAEIEALTIADDAGIWLTLRNVTLDWTRSALLRRRLEVDRLSAAEIRLDRWPEPTPGLPSPEAQGFRLPELPVSLRVDALQADRIVLGEQLFGDAAELSLAGSLTLADGAGSASLNSARTDGREGSLELDATFDNATRVLSLDLDLTEGAEGIAAGLLSIPGRPPLRLAVSGNGPLSDFASELALDTDGEERLRGRLSLIETPAGARLFEADLGGDIAPLFAPGYREFFGQDIRLRAAGGQRPEGGFQLSEFSLAAAAVTLSGTLSLNAAGLPVSFDLTGAIASADGAPVLLPLPGPPTRVERAGIELAFDAAQGDRWSGRATLAGLERPGFRAERMALDGQGRISDRDDRAEVLALVGFAAEALDLGDPAADTALGETVRGGTRIYWTTGQPVSVTELEIEGDTYELAADGEISAGENGPVLSGSMRAEARDLSALAGLADRPLSGAAELAVRGRGEPLGGAFDVTLDGETSDLTIGSDEIDPLLRGRAELRLRARRDAEGTHVDSLFVRSPEAEIRARGTIATEANRGELSAILRSPGFVAPGLEGPMSLSAEVEEGEPRRFKTLVRLQGPGLAAGATGQLSLERDVPEFDGRLEADLDAIAPFSTLAGRPLSGAVIGWSEGRISTDLSLFDVTARIETRDLTVGVSELDTLLAGTAVLDADLTREGEQVDVRMARLEAPRVQAEVAGRIGEDTAAVEVSARLDDLARLAPGLDGPASAIGRIGRTDGGDWEVRATAEGPGGSQVEVAGSVVPALDAASLRFTGEAPLALAGRFTAPRAVSGPLRFDLALDGPLSLASLSGTLQADGARIVSPAEGLVVQDIAARAVLANGRAELDLGGSVQEGGRLRLAGPVSLSGPFPADLDITLTRVVLRDPRLFETTIDGTLGIDGGLANGARISGRLVLDSTELRIPSTSVGGVTPIPEIQHRGEPAASRATRARAGLTDATGGNGEDAGRAFDLDISIEAPSRLFLRGRGLDAEFGGTLRLRGTTREVIPEGQVSLIRGRLDLLGRRINLTEGQVTLQGAFDPYLRLVAESRAEDVTVRIVVEGLASNPEIRFLSEPELPEDEVLARLLFGRGLDTLSPFQAAQLASAVATLAGRGGEGIVGRLRQGFGLDDLDVTSGDEGTTAVRAGKYISDNVYSDVVVDSIGRAEVTLNLDISPSFTVRGSVNNEGGTGVGVFFERDY